LKGVDMDVNAAYAAMHHAFTTQQARAGFDVASWLKYGYLPFDTDHSGCSETLELAFNAASMSVIAKALGKQSDFLIFQNQSTWYKNNWNPKYKFFLPENN